MANIPFVINRPLAPWPWRRAGANGAAASVSGRWILCCIYLLLLALWSWATMALVGGSFVGGAASALVFLLKLLVSALVATVLLWLPGYWAARAALLQADMTAATAVQDSKKKQQRDPYGARAKPFSDRLLEVLIGYVLVGTLGFAFELSMGNAFAQGWEFYAVSLAMFLVFAYPGFVWRYMLRRRRG